jgi:hypothetical protein
MSAHHEALLAGVAIGPLAHSLLLSIVSALGVDFDLTILKDLALAIIKHKCASVYWLEKLGK